MFSMLKIVLPQIFKKSATVLYPIEAKERPAGMRGHVVNHIDDCIVCGICQNKCPSGAITVDRAARTWAIARFDCIQCAHCVNVCPRKCLKMLPERPKTIMEKTAYVMQAPPKADP